MWVVSIVEGVGEVEEAEDRLVKPPRRNPGTM